MNLPSQFFLYVGNAYPHKNLERLLEAYQHVTSHISPVTLILVGGEDYFYKQLKEKVRQMGLADSVVFYGPASRGELNNLYKNTVALVFPSLMEGFGLPGLEAMANGCPVICSDIPVFREIYGEAAIYFNPTDANDIKNKMDSLCYHDLNHDIREEMARKGHEQVKKYSWQKLARQTLAVYNEIHR